MPMKLKARRDTAARWTSINPILADGELGLETDTRQFKFGDGSTRWNSLPYASGGGGGSVPADVLRASTTGVVIYAETNAVVGADFVIPGYYRKTASGWDFPPHLQEQSFERFAITAFPYTPTFADVRNGMIFLQPAAAAVVNLPSGLVSSPAMTDRRSYQDVLFYIDGAVTVTFTASAGVSLYVPGVVASQASYAATGPRKVVGMQARSTNYRVID